MGDKFAAAVHPLNAGQLIGQQTQQIETLRRERDGYAAVIANVDMVLDSWRSQYADNSQAMRWTREVRELLSAVPSDVLAALIRTERADAWEEGVRSVSITSTRVTTPPNPYRARAEQGANRG